MSKAEPTHLTTGPKRESQLEKEPGYRNNCTTGTLTGLWEAHHILTLDSMRKRTADYPNSPPDLAKYLANCLRVTPWNINNSDNLSGLP
ncbi:MAG TPA: hypothetical protein VEU33_47655, partial [Archangium sp.]|nr:hypothetical protein [Archangium sp.]